VLPGPQTIGYLFFKFILLFPIKNIDYHFIPVYHSYGVLLGPYYACLC
jgi:hypothetical protein